MRTHRTPVRVVLCTGVVVSSLVFFASLISLTALGQAGGGKKASPTPTPTPTPPAGLTRSNPAVAATGKAQSTTGPAAKNPAVENPTTKGAQTNATQVRPIASLTADDRNRLPDDTMVALKSRTVSLGTLRAEHRARLERFAKAAALGQTLAAKLVPVQPPPAAGSTKPQSSAGLGTKNPTGQGGQAGTLAEAGSRWPHNLAPFQMPHFNGTIPKDYADICNKPSHSVCLYLPANATFVPVPNNPKWVEDLDPLIIDKTVCETSGGQQAQDGWAYYYPITYLVNFLYHQISGVALACNPPSKYLFDPKGAFKAWVPPPVATTGPDPIFYAAQVQGT